MLIKNRCLRCLLGLLVIFAVSACTSTRRGVQRLASSHLADTATSYNLAIEQTQDEMLLLNVIRAQDNYPLYITDASKVTGTVKVDASLGLKFPLVHMGKANDYFATPTLEYSTSPAMDVNLFNTKDFMAGFLAPIPIEVLQYYWEQQWPSEFLLYLVVLKVDQYTESKDGTLSFEKTFYNHPDVSDPEHEDLKEFAGWVYEVLKTGRPLLCPKEENAAVGPPFDADDLDTLKYLVPVAKEGLAVGPAATDAKPAAVPAGKLQLSRPKKSFSLVLYNDEHKCSGVPAPSVAGGAISSIEKNKEPGQQDLVGPTLIKEMAKPGNVVVTGQAADGKRPAWVLHLRSPEGVLYYLGQLARLENRGQIVQQGNRPPEVRRQALLIHICDYGSSCAKRRNNKPPVSPLFVALDKAKHGDCHPIIWVRSLDSRDYLIPETPEGAVPPQPISYGSLQMADASQLCDTGRTMHALDLLSQLIGLQKSAKDFTTTSTVKVLGQ